MTNSDRSHQIPRLDRSKPASNQSWLDDTRLLFKHSNGYLRINDTVYLDYLDDVAWACQTEPAWASQKKILSSEFTQDFAVYNAQTQLGYNRTFDALATMFASGAQPLQLAMFTHWVEKGLRLHTTHTDNQCLRVVRYFTQCQELNTFDLAWTLLAGAHTLNSELVNILITDKNTLRTSIRLACLVTHSTPEGQWWDAYVEAMGHANLPQPLLPIAKTIITRKERDYQAWWRYTDEMVKTDEFQWFFHWVDGLNSKIPTFDINHLV